MNTYCKTTLNYAGAVEYDPIMTEIVDARSVEPAPTFETHGFCLAHHPSNVSDWRDETLVNDKHRPEIAELAREITGAESAIVYPALVRSPQTAATEADYAPIESVHSDYTGDFRRMVSNPDHTYQGFLGPSLAENGLSVDDVIKASRLLVIQFWRNIGEQYPDRPLAVCEPESTRLDEMIPIKVAEYGGQRLDFEVFAVRTPSDPERHHWYTYPGMQSDEVLCFKTYDSLLEDEGRAFWTPHSAFRDPNVGPDAPARESVEMRALCLFS
ncbi:MAG: CmcJ/NvfI family oxidoreductase [Pseudomonadota bacterium]